MTLRLRHRRRRHEEHELLAAAAHQHVDPSCRRTHAVDEDAQHLVAHRVAVLVVHQLEVIEVDEKKAQRSPAPARALHLLDQPRREVARR